MKIKFLLISLLLAVGACSNKGSDTEEAKKLYDEGIEAVYRGSYDTAKTKLSKIDEEFPYTSYANDASLLLAYVNYRKEEYSEALPIIDIYIKINPGDPNIPYLLYLRAMIFYDQIRSYKKDKEILLEFKSMAELMRAKFSSSPYRAALDAKYEYVVNMLRLGELDVALQYHKKGNCIAATPHYLSLLRWEEPNYAPTVRKNLSSCFNLLGVQEKANFYSVK